MLTESRASKVVVKADGGIKCGAEWPHIEVEIDDVPVMSAFVEGVNQTLEAPVSLPAGTHVVRVRFDNDYFEPTNAFSGGTPLPLTCDRNLLLDSLELVDDRWHDDASAADASPGASASEPAAASSLRPDRWTSADILWTGDAEKAWDDSLEGRRWPDNNEWVGLQLRGPVALQPGHQPGGPGQARLPDRGP